MKIVDAINRIDSLMRSTYSQNDKVAWLSDLDWDVKRNIIDGHEGDEEVTFTGYDDLTDLQTELLMPAPYDNAYLLYLEAQINYYNGEYDKYNNAMDSFHTTIDGYRNDYNRNHMPKGKKIKYF